MHRSAQGEAHVSAAALTEVAPWAAWVEDFMRHFLQCLRYAAPRCADGQAFADYKAFLLPC